VTHCGYSKQLDLSSEAQGVGGLGGYTGKLLNVDLTSERIREERLPEKDKIDFLGGRGLAARILFDLGPDVDPLGPKNQLIFMTGPLTGTPMLGSGRHVVAAISPLTGLMGQANTGGFFGSELKFAGYDGIVIEGASENPVYISIRDGSAEICEAGHLWGKLVSHTDKALRHELGDEKTRLSIIGPAGERLVKFSGVINERSRAAARCGLGAVMGSKKLKAIAVRGSGKIELSNEARIRDVATKMARMARERQSIREFSAYGTPSVLAGLNEAGMLPTQNFRSGVFKGAEKISGETLKSDFVVGVKACYGCSVACWRVVDVKDGPYAPVHDDSLEYETIAAFGSLCMNDNLQSIIKANKLCNEYGLDTISTGNVTAFAMECYERGLITKSETGGVTFEWGNHGAIVRTIQQIAKREGVGRVLSEGVKRASEMIGKGAEELSMHVKGMEIPMHEPRGKKGVGLSYATANRGACHLAAVHDAQLDAGRQIPEIALPVKQVSRLKIDWKAHWDKRYQDYWAMVDSLVACKFTVPLVGPGTLTDIRDAISATTGRSITVDDLVLIGERIYNLERSYNLMKGLSRKDDTLPKRFTEPLPEGGSKGSALTSADLDKMLDEYYELRGWDKNTGNPRYETLKRLGLEYVENHLYS